MPQESDPGGVRMTSRLVALTRVSSGAYPLNPPFDPSEEYPELHGIPVETSTKNDVFKGVRQILATVGLDGKHFGSRMWNPMRDLAPERGTILIKPNLVSEPRNLQTAPESITTHGSVIRPLIEYSLKAVGDEGSVLIADAPQFDSDFGEIVRLNGLAKTVEILSERYDRNIPLLDLRAERVIVEDGIVTERVRLDGDPKGYKTINLGESSRLSEIDAYSSRYRGSDYDRSVTVAHHSRGRNEYSISNTVLSADLVISVPKLKTHKKAGVTLNLKNFIGVNGHKNLIPHYRIGSKSDGGDEMASQTLKARTLSKAYDLTQNVLPKLGQTGVRLMKKLRRLDMAVIGTEEAKARFGDWHGNDTIWRSIHDLYHIVALSDKKGCIGSKAQRRLFSIVDGIIAGEGNGPLSPRSRPEKILIGGESLIAVDLAAIAAMGLRFEALQTYSRLESPLIEKSIGEFVDSIEIDCSVGRRISTGKLYGSVQRPFELPDGWKHLSEPAILHGRQEP
jgi:uncharacterized protein (DUF362 family)